RARLVHRDVKPANILVDARPGRPDHVYLSDFGVSKGAISSVSLTGAGHFVGTPDYSAPEQIQGLAIDGRTDQYALACVAFQLLTGTLPFGRDQGMAVLFAHLSEPPPLLAARRPGLPAAVDAVLSRGMAKAPEKRFGSCTGFADALREALGVLPYDSAATSAPARPPHPAAAPVGPPHPAAAPRPVTMPSASYGPSATPTVDRRPDGARTVAPAGSGHARSRSRASGSPRRRRPAAVAAAAALVAVAVTVLLTIGWPGHGSGPGTGKSAKLVYAEDGRVPPYYVWITPRGNPNSNPSDAEVRLTATGAALGTIRAAAPGGTVVAATGAADDRTFVLDEQPWGKPSVVLPSDTEPRTFYLLRLSASGKPDLITKLPISVPSGEHVAGLALSPDGTKLAMGIARSSIKTGVVTDVTLFSIPAGKVLRTWSLRGVLGNIRGEDAEALSWTSGQRMLAFLWMGYEAPDDLGTTQSQFGEWLLDTGKGGSDLIGDSRYVTSLPSSTLVCSDVIVAPDGSTVVCGAGNSSPSSPESTFEEFSTATGKLTRTLGHWARTTDIDVLWSNPSGSVLVGVAPVAGADHVGMITAGRFTPLPRLGSSVLTDQGVW
ncbi:MAG: protein kinase domain-containing protein, partial [Streptosporangiaceae bacterium]